ncbi:TRAP transporter small permease [Nitratidesulfovibrio liaohensis]|uniref:TRAP transporter small permease n=1 Tax=Nitratidesulfovibrio liaohensis TaxID=2604158 RepID=A0ABY9QY21_9BACT|nr:TRAP transporter small permease [Nitratidesulfovibrio liaohensis]WMW64430.1 TRAP transporter small permease [Nitratidesulfovibrio liaohensis]
MTVGRTAASPPVPTASGTGGGRGPGPAAARGLLAVAARCDAVARVWLAGATLAMAGLLIVQVVFRYAFNNSLFWSEELGRALLVQLTFIGASVAWRGRAHIGMDALVARFSPQWAWRARLLVLCVCVAFFAAVAWHGARFALFLLPQQTAALGVSRAVVFVAVPVGAALLTLHGLADLLAHIWPDASGESGTGGTGAGGAPLPCGTAGRDAGDAGNEAGRDTGPAAVSSSFTEPGGITPEGR